MIQSPHPKSHCWHSPRPQGKQRYSHQACHFKGLDITSKKARAKAGPVFGQGWILSYTCSTYVPNIIKIIDYIQSKTGKSFAIVDLVNMFYSVPFSIAFQLKFALSFKET